MNRQKAIQIVEEYGAVLEKKGESRLAVASMSMLPHPKNQIKDAIKYLLLWPESPSTTRTKNSLEVGWTLLADFVEDDEAQIVTSFNEWVRKTASVEQTETELGSSPNSAEKATEVTSRVAQESKRLLKELRTMGRIVTYENQSGMGTFCQVRLNSGEKVLISIAQTDIRVVKLAIDSLIPTKVIWKSSNIPELVKLFSDEGVPDRSILDGIILKVVDCKSTDEIKRLLDATG